MRISKWKQYKHMSKFKNLVPYLPSTVQFSRRNFWKMIEQHRDVVIKPNWGRMGYKILHVSLIDEYEELYEVHHEGIKKRMQGKKEIYSFIKQHCRNREYIIQQKIPLASIYGCPFDIRVMVQRLTHSSKWCITGKLARVAESGFFVTNEAQELAPFEDVIPRSSVKDCPLEELSSKIERLVLTAASSFNSTYPHCRIIGFDIGIQDDGSIRIIEANFNPMLSLFSYLDDKSMYRTIRKYNRGVIR